MAFLFEPDGLRKFTPGLILIVIIAYYEINTAATHLAQMPGVLFLGMFSLSLFCSALLANDKIPPGHQELHHYLRQISEFLTPLSPEK